NPRLTRRPTPVTRRPTADPAERGPTLRRVADLKSAYLVCGDDDAKIDAWRGRVRRRAEEENGPGGLETFDARTSGPGEVAAELSALTFGAGTRYVLVDGVESWKAGELEPLERELASPAPDT